MKKIEEFWYCVSPQEDLPLVNEDKINASSSSNLIKFIDLIKKKHPEQKTENYITDLIIAEPELIEDIRLLVGVSDKRFYLDLTYIANYSIAPDGSRIVSETRRNLKKHSTSYFINKLKKESTKIVYSRLITDYFVKKGLIDILSTFTSLDDEQITPIFNNLIAPKEIQQMQAKYRGHGAERAFAKIFKACGLHFIPETKDIDPMAGYDPNVNLSKMIVVPRDASDINSHSFDLVVTDSQGNIRVLVQSLIHSSDPGQYGVNKSDETREIHNLILKYNESTNNKIYLLGSVDGVGFSENPNGTIVKMLDYFDDFFQIHTLFKIPLFLQSIGLINNVSKIALDPDYFDNEFIEDFSQEYLSTLNIELTPFDKDDIDESKVISAGKGIVYFC